MNSLSRLQRLPEALWYLLLHQVQDPRQLISRGTLKELALQRLTNRVAALHRSLLFSASKYQPLQKSLQVMEYSITTKTISYMLYFSYPDGKGIEGRFGSAMDDSRRIESMVGMGQCMSIIPHSGKRVKRSGNNETFPLRHPLTTRKYIAAQANTRRALAAPLRT